MQSDAPSVALVPQSTIDIDATPVVERSDPPIRPAEQASARWHLRALRTHPWLALAVLLLVVGAAAIFSMIATPIYEARAKLLIEPESPNVVAFKEVVEQNTSKLDYYETQIGILRSRTLARKTLDRLALWNAPDRAGPDFPWLSRIGAWLATARGNPPAADETIAQSRAIDAFLSRLTLTYRVDNRLVDVRVRSVDARRAADVANALAGVFIAEKIAIKVQASKEASTWLQARLAEQRARVQASELAVQQYRERNQDVTLDGQENVAVRKLAELSAAATRAKTERIEAASLYGQLQAIRNTPSASDTLPIVQSNTYVQQLKAQLASLQRDEVTKAQQLGERHPDMLEVRSAIRRIQAQLDAEVAAITEAARNQELALETRERNLLSALAAQKQLALGISRQAIEYAALEREATSNRQIFEGLLQRAKEAELSSELHVTNVRVIDPAETPQAPVFPRRGLNLLLALLIGVPLAIGSAIAREYLDDRIKSPEQITADLGIRFLGFAPIVPRNVASAGVPMLDEWKAPAFAEALRAVRTNLLLSAPAQRARTLLVTSTGPGEGKTLVACNLAVALARASRRVLIVDADMRRAHVHKMFDVPLEPGLTAVLQDGLAIADAMHSTSISGLSILTSGVSRGVPGDLLQQSTLAKVLASILHEFDWIIIDSPPVMVASDAIALAQTATAVVFVVGAHMIRAREAKAALEQLAPTGATIIGAVLSRSDDKQSPYSYAKYRSYYSGRRDAA